MTTISEPQRWKILKLWTAYCQERGWKSSDRALRLATIGAWIGRELATLDDLGKMDECTEVLSRLGAVVRPTDFNGQVKLAKMPKTNLLVRIGEFDPGLVKHLLKQRFTFAVWLRNHHPEFAGATISKGTAAKPARNPAPDWIVQEYRDAAPAAPALEDLDERELTQLRNTLAREVSRQPVSARQPDPVAVGSDDPDWNV